MNFAADSNLKRACLGLICPLLMQAALTAGLGFANVKWKIDSELPLYFAFAITSGGGFHFLTRGYTRKEKALIALGFFPLLLIVDAATGVYILLSIPGARGNF